MADGDGAAIPLDAIKGLSIIPTSKADPERPTDRSANTDVWAVIASQVPDRRGAYYVLASWPRTDAGLDDAHDALDALVIELTNESPGVYSWNSERNAWGVLRYTDTAEYHDLAE